eukprot:COSAG01_NODE_790_length_13572_cov_4.015587_5_plen_114_part_00
MSTRRIAASRCPLPGLGRAGTHRRARITAAVQYGRIRTASQHIYAKVTGMPFFKRFTNVCADPDFHVDLITGDHCNVWEPPLRQFTGTMQTYKWSVLEDHFNIEVVADMYMVQ